MKDWNLVISVYSDGYNRALRALRALGPVERSSYYNVLVMNARDPMELLAAIERRTEEVPALYDAISRVAPAMRCFDFASEPEFREKAAAVMLEWVPQLAGRSFHVRLHRRGAAHDLRTQDEERFFDELLLEAAKRAGMPGRISFTDSDVVIAIDTVDDRVGIGLWTRHDLADHRLLRPD